MSIGLVRKWSDTGAPTLWANQWGNPLDLFEAVLVTGYGDKPGLGWTKEYASPDESIRVFRSNPNTGSGFYLQLTHNSSSFIPTNELKFNAYESMSSYDTGVNPMIYPVNHNCFLFAETTGTSCPNGIHWMIIGDDLGFYFCTRRSLSLYPNITSENSGRLWFVSYLGEYIPFNSEQPFPVAGMVYLRVISTEFSGNFKNNIILRAGLKEDFPAPVGMSSGSYYETNVFGSTPNISPYNGITLLTPIMIHPVDRQPIGLLPGIYNPLRQRADRGVLGYYLDEEWTFQDNTIHILQYSNLDPNNSPRIAILSGKGYRNVI